MYRFPKSDTECFLLFHLDQATVQKFASGSWTLVGTADFSAESAIKISLAVDSTGAPFVAYGDGANSGKATVQKYA